jgi:flagellar biosynthesis/type III secretory pathway M-ring protein FliF/YscJ
MDERSTTLASTAKVTKISYLLSVSFNLGTTVHLANAPFENCSRAAKIVMMDPYNRPTSMLVTCLGHKSCKLTMAYLEEKEEEVDVSTSDASEEEEEEEEAEEEAEEEEEEEEEEAEEEEEEEEEEETVSTF